MMKKFIPILLLMAVQFTVIAQQVKFRKVIGNSGYDEGYSAKQTSDKGYIVAGSTSSFGSGNTDIYIFKTDSLGIPYIHKAIGGINIEKAKCIRQTSDKGYIVLGYTNSYGAGGYDFYMIKVDSALNTQWEKTYGGTDWDFGNCVEQTNDGGYILCGSTYSFGKGNTDYYLIRTNSTGDTLWTKTFGGANEDVANSVIQTSDGGYILTGTTKSMGDTLGDFYTIKTDTLGDTTWTNKFGGPKADYGNDILESIMGGYIVGGETQSFSYVVGVSDGMIVRISPTGVTGPSSSTGYSSPQYDNIESITEDQFGRIAMVGRDVSLGDPGGNGDVHLFIEYDNLSFFNATTFGYFGYDNGYSIEATSDHGFIICGKTTSFNNMLDDIYLIKTDSMGLAGFTGSEDNLLIGVTEQHQAGKPFFSLYPNPANNIVNISIPRNDIHSEVIITDMLGNEVKHFLAESDSFNFSSVDLSEGMYYITVKGKNNNSTQKLIITH